MAPSRAILLRRAAGLRPAGRAALSAVALLLALAVAGGKTGWAQGSGGYGTPDTTATAEGDTLVIAHGDTLVTAEGDTLVSALPDTSIISAARRSGERFSPTYSSKYDINRTTDSWSQNFNFGSWAGPIDLTSVTSITLGRDRTLDRRSKNNSTNFTFGYRLGQELRVSSILGIIRNSTVDAGRTNTSQDTDAFGIEANYTRRLAYGLTGNFKAETGTTRDTRTDPLTSSRESTGPHAMGSAVFSAKRWADWTFTTLIRDSRLSSTESRTGETTSDHNRQTDLGLTATFKVPGFDNWQVSTGRHLNQLQYPFLVNESVGDTILTVARQETNLNLTRDISLNVSASPLRRMTISGTADYRNNDINREIDTERSQQSIDHGAGARIGYDFSDSTHTDLRGDWHVARSLYDAESRVTLNGDAVNRSLGASIRRPLGPRAGFDVGGNYALQQFLFDDTTANTDDRDIVRGDATARIDYRPAPKVNTYIRTNFQVNQTIFLDASKSGSNQTQQVYAVYPALEYQVTKLVMFREEGSIVANATVFDFDENRNRLSRTTELRTSIDSQILPRVGLGLRYTLRFLQDGSYARDEDGIRRFGKSNENTSRDVGFRVDYTPIAGGNAYFRTTLRNNDSKAFQLRGGHVVEIASENEFNEIELGARLNRTLSFGLSVGVDVRRFQSWTDRGNHENYWLGSVNVGQKF
jgi:hypothetical protein